MAKVGVFRLGLAPCTYAEYQAIVKAEKERARGIAKSAAPVTQKIETPKTTDKPKEENTGATSPDTGAETLGGTTPETGSTEGGTK